MKMVWFTKIQLTQNSCCIKTLLMSYDALNIPMRIGSDGWLWSQCPWKHFCLPNRDDLRLELATEAESLRPIGNRLSQHYEGLAYLILRHGAFPLKAKVLDTSWSFSPFTFPLLAWFQVHSFSYVSGSKFPKQYTKFFLTIMFPFLYTTILTTAVKCDHTNFLRTISKVSILLSQLSMGRETGSRRTSCSRTIVLLRKTDERREIPKERMIDRPRNKSTEMRCRFRDGRQSSTVYYGITQQL